MDEAHFSGSYNGEQREIWNPKMVMRKILILKILQVFGLLKWVNEIIIL